MSAEIHVADADAAVRDQVIREGQDAERVVLRVIKIQGMFITRKQVKRMFPQALEVGCPFQCPRLHQVSCQVDGAGSEDVAAAVALQHQVATDCQGSIGRLHDQAAGGVNIPVFPVLAMHFIIAADGKRSPFDFDFSLRLDQLAGNRS